MRLLNRLFKRRGDDVNRKSKKIDRKSHDANTTFSEISSDDSENNLVMRLNSIFRDDARYMRDGAQELLSNHNKVLAEEDFEQMLSMIGDDYSVVGFGSEKRLDHHKTPKIKESTHTRTPLSDSESVLTLPIRNTPKSKDHGPFSSFVHLSLLPTHRDHCDDELNNSYSYDSDACSLNSLSLTGRDVVISSLQACIRMHATEDEIKKAWTTRESLPVQVDDGTLTMFTHDDKPLERVDRVVRSYLIRQEYKSAIELYDSLKRSIVKRKVQSDFLKPLLVRLAILNLIVGKERRAHAYCLNLVNCSDVKKEEYVEALVLSGLIQFGCNRLREAHSTWREAAYKGGRDNKYAALLWNNMACLKTQLGSIEEAKESIEHSLTLQKRMSIVASDANEGILNSSITLSNYAVISEIRKEYVTAGASLEECLLLQESILSVQNYAVRATKEHLNRITRLESYRQSKENSSKECRRLKESVFDESDCSPLPYPRMEMGGSVDLIRMGCLTNEDTPNERVQQLFMEAFRSLQVSKTRSRSKPSTSPNRSKLPVDIDGTKIIDAELNISRIYSDVSDYLAHDQVNEALDLLKCCLKSYRDNYGMLHPLVASTLHNIGVVLIFAHRYGAALIYFEQASSIRVSTLGADHPEVASSLMKVGLLQVSECDFDNALKTFTQILHILRKSLGYHHSQVVKALNNIACIHSMCCGSVAATKAIEEAIEILRNSSESQSLSVLSILLGNYGFILSKRGLNCDAVQAFEEARNLQLSMYSANHPALALTTSNLTHSMFLDRESRKTRNAGFLNFIMKPLQCSSL